MTPYKSGGRGTYLLERTFPGVGLVKRASGTKLVNQWKALDKLLSTFWAHGRLDVLAAIRDGKLHPMKAFDIHERLGMEGFPRHEVLVELAAVQRWADTRKGKSKRHTQGVQSNVRVLLRAAHELEAVKDIPAILRRFKTTAPVVTFNRCRAAALAYLHETFGNDHPLYLATKAVPAHRYKAPGGDPFTVEQLVKWRLPEPLNGMVWSMCLTGMGQGDYWGSWKMGLDRVQVPGVKDRPRIVPRVGEIVLPSWPYKRTKDAFREATGHRLYDCRNSYAVWLEEAGVHASRIPLYMGHTIKNQTHHYQRRKVEPYLQGDAKLLSTYIGKAQRAVRAG